ncbi:MAG: hypothetical protein IT348_15040 [Candidatus Eisenbacteria bacterium]|nr:hypothetical protein [Candidatus Eisenbacteria bacterium]
MNRLAQHGTEPEMKAVSQQGTKKAYQRPQVEDHVEPNASVVFGSNPTSDCAGVHKPPPPKG